MSWSTLDPEVREIAERVCTPRQLEALKLKASGFGNARIARVLGVSKPAARDRLDGADRAIRRELARQHAGTAA